MHRYIVMITALILSMSATHAQPDRWQKITADKDGTWFLDLETAADRGEGGTRKLWILHNLRSTQNSPWGTYLSVKYLMLIDCELSRSTIRTFISYPGQMGAGAPVVARTPRDEWHDFVPGGALEPAMNAACGR